RSLQMIRFLLVLSVLCLTIIAPLSYESTPSNGTSTNGTTEAINALTPTASPARAILTRCYDKFVVCFAGRGCLGSSRMNSKTGEHEDIV
ncbi:hypothetical protein PFISCL1PPCAC_22083, partial [Pristionchus fissidentatus]